MENQEHSHLEQIEPLCILRLLARKFWLIVLAALTAAMAAAVILTTAVSQTYSTSVTFAVLSRAYGASGYASVSVATEVAQIYSELLSGSYMNETIQEAAGDVSGTITAHQLGDTNLIQVTVTSANPQDALKIIQVVVEKQAGLSEYVSSTAVLNPIDSMSIAVNTTGARSTMKVCILAALGGGALMALLLASICVGSMTVQTRAGAKKNLDGKLLTSIPHEVMPERKKGKGGGRLLISDPLVSFGFTESINRVCALLEHENAKGRKVFLLSSTYESEGKSTIAANLALALEKKSCRVLLIDLDLRSPVLYRILGEEVPSESELSQLLVSGVTAEEILDKAIPRPGSELNLLLASKPNAKLVRLLDSAAFARLIDLARQRYDYVIIDTPPLSYFSDSQRLSDLADASLLVVRQDMAPAPDINDAMDALRAGKSEFMGYVLNDMQHLLPGSSEYGYHYGSRYYGRYGKYGRYGHYGKYGAYAKGHSKEKYARRKSDESSRV